MCRDVFLQMQNLPMDMPLYSCKLLFMDMLMLMFLVNAKMFPLLLFHRYVYVNGYLQMAKSSDKLLFMNMDMSIYSCIRMHILMYSSGC